MGEPESEEIPDQIVHQSLSVHQMSQIQSVKKMKQLLNLSVNHNVLMKHP